MPVGIPPSRPHCVPGSSVPYSANRREFRVAELELGLRLDYQDGGSPPPPHRPLRPFVSVSLASGAFHVGSLPLGEGSEPARTAHGCPVRRPPAGDGRIGRPPVGTSLIGLATPSQGNKMYRCLSRVSLVRFPGFRRDGRTFNCIVPFVVSVDERRASHQLSGEKKHMYHFPRVFDTPPKIIQPTICAQCHACDPVANAFVSARNAGNSGARKERDD